MSYYDNILQWWDGVVWQPVEIAPINAKAIPATSIATTTSLTASPATINAGETVTLTATVTGATAGSVKFTGGSLGAGITDTASPWTTTNAPTASTTYYAEYLANGNYLGSKSTGKTVTVKQKVTKTATGPAKSSSNWEWKQSSAPFQVASTLTVGSGKDIPYSTAYVTKVVMWVSGYNGTSTCRAGLWNNGSPATLLGSSPNTTTASGGDTAGEVKQTTFTFSSPITVTTGTYNIGFWRDDNAGTAWAKSSTISGRTIWEDNSATAIGTLNKDASEGSLSLSWVVTYYIWQ